MLSPQEYRERYQAFVHRLPPHPRLKDYLLFVPLAVYKFVDRLCDAFGFKVRPPLFCVGVRGGDSS